ncbi:50S ribosomal protein L18 [candidate division WOR-3 bacterium]|uniref:Large ribosomal subunit protein uL18 n=1 Tax=candidate division WOR-3 bacterium TaxID=2052148 RepID=A0A9D5K7L0_UNCW3|nr:50S ribosomal protein L18 [candidate division WOR-3 bacterium]MBD3363796.1 50S ribosomal protein L18 [candidate division WOR-3 bacterium]
MKPTKYFGRRRRHLHLRNKIKGTGDRPRLVVFRSNRHIYAQAVDDSEGKVITGVSSLSAALKEVKVKGDKKAFAEAVGRLIAAKLSKLGIKKVVFDRAGYRYHGRVKALADAARKEGLEF